MLSPILYLFVHDELHSENFTELSWKTQLLEKWFLINGWYVIARMVMPFNSYRVRWQANFILAVLSAFLSRFFRPQYSKVPSYK